MKIILSKGNGKPVKVEQSELKGEQELENYIANNPDTLPLDDISKDVHLLTLAQQLETRSGEALDVVAVDQGGNIYVIETKLYANQDKRKVVAQVLDYGASLWRKFTNGRGFLEAIEKNASLDAKLKETFGLDDTTDIRAAIARNVEHGNFRFVVLMDQISDALKDLILFLNARSQFKIFGAEMKFYEHDGYRIVIPHLFGGEAKPPVSESWDDESFFEDVAAKGVDVEIEQGLRNLHAYSKEIGALRWGRGSSASFNVVRESFGTPSIMTVFSDGVVWLNFKQVQKTDWAKRFRMAWINKLNEAGFDLPADAHQRYLQLPGDWPNRFEAFRHATSAALCAPKDETEAAVS